MIDMARIRGDHIKSEEYANNSCFVLALTNSYKLLFREMRKVTSSTKGQPRELEADIVWSDRIPLLVAFEMETFAHHYTQVFRSYYKKNNERVQNILCDRNCYSVFVVRSIVGGSFRLHRP